MKLETRYLTTMVIKVWLPIFVEISGYLIMNFNCLGYTAPGDDELCTDEALEGSDRELFPRTTPSITAMTKE
jgi:hypothetical protein